MLNFDDSCKKAFDILKEKLASTHIIQALDWNYPLEIMCDASNYAVGVVLGQKIGKSRHVIYYASRRLDHAQVLYSTTEKELLAIILLWKSFALIYFVLRSLFILTMHLLSFCLRRKMLSQDSYVGFFYRKNLAQK